MSTNKRVHLLLVPVTSALALCSTSLLTPGLTALEDKYLESDHPLIQMVLKERPVSFDEMLIADGDYAKCHTKGEVPTPIGPIKFSKDANCPKLASVAGIGEKDTDLALEAEQLVTKLLLT